MTALQEISRPLKCVLSIDDEEDIQSIIRISLERLGGIKAHFCSDPRHGLARAREVGPDLILLDLLMPNVDGAALFRSLQADPELSSIPVVFLTAVMSGPAAKNMESLGAAGILVKPFDVAEPAQAGCDLERIAVSLSRPPPPRRRRGLPVLSCPR